MHITGKEIYLVILLIGDQSEDRRLNPLDGYKIQKFHESRKVKAKKIFCVCVSSQELIAILITLRNVPTVDQPESDSMKIKLTVQQDINY